MDRYRITPGRDVDLSQWDANDKGDFPGGKAEGKDMLGGLNSKMASLQRRLYAQGKHKVLVILQAMDTGGKD
ncbi:MAG: polyphosphate kinase 2 family protein, partial [Acidimicrobiia bacterium]|nr:polyphosphate kinase 2 family protein [Acidimicrobiia bacterium]